MKSDVDKLYQITELNKIYIFITNKLFFLKIFRVSKFSLKFFDTEIHNLELSNVIKCWQGPKQTCISQCDRHLCYWQVFYLKPFSFSKFSKRPLLHNWFSVEVVQSTGASIVASELSHPQKCICREVVAILNHLYKCSYF